MKISFESPQLKKTSLLKIYGFLSTIKKIIFLLVDKFYILVCCFLVKETQSKKYLSFHTTPPKSDGFSSVIAESLLVNIGEIQNTEKYNIHGKNTKNVACFKAFVTMVVNIQYSRNKADISEAYYSDLARVGKFLTENSTLTATIEGYVDNTSSTSAIVAAQLLAQKVVTYLVNKIGIDYSRLSIENFGYIRRFSYDATNDEYPQNGHVNVIINYPNF